MGQARSASPQCVPDCESASGKFSCQARLGAVHRCCNRRSESEEAECCLPAVGQICRVEGQRCRQRQAPCFDCCPPIWAVSKQGEALQSIFFDMMRCCNIKDETQFICCHRITNGTLNSLKSQLQVLLTWLWYLSCRDSLGASTFPRPTRIYRITTWRPLTGKLSTTVIRLKCFMLRN